MSDLISRQAAIDLFKKWQPRLATNVAEFGDALETLPSAQLERKKGEWRKSYADHEAFGIRPFFRYCSECHESTVYPYNFCPHCGADMRGGANE